MQDQENNSQENIINEQNNTENNTENNKKSITIRAARLIVLGIVSIGLAIAHATMPLNMYMGGGAGDMVAFFMWPGLVLLCAVSIVRGSTALADAKRKKETINNPEVLSATAIFCLVGAFSIIVSFPLMIAIWRM